MSLVVGYVFMGSFSSHSGSKWNSYLKTVALVAPAIILHEFGHKFLGLAFGLSATFEANYPLLLIGAALKFFNSPFIFVAPAYIALAGTAPSWVFALTALAGPLVNGILWAVFKFVVVPHHTNEYTLAFMRLNGLLALFNLIPFPGFDGFHIVTALLP